MSWPRSVPSSAAQPSSITAIARTPEPPTASAHTSGAALNLGTATRTWSGNPRRCATSVSKPPIQIAAPTRCNPSALTGHAGYHLSPGVAMVALGLHLVGAAIWIGGLLTLVAHLRGFPDHVRVAVPRFSAAPLVCALAVGGSGVLAFAVML